MPVNELADGADWLADAVLYEVYPQSFADSDGDGVGDLRGVADRLDYIASLGVDAIWFNPCFASPFVDAGYDVSNYLTIASSYGTNADMVELVSEARRRGIRVLLDLVAGHTSIEHEWFQRELHADGPDPEGDRYVWRDDPPTTKWHSDTPGTPAWVASSGPRQGWYLKNFYDEQPALDFGWTDASADAPWRSTVDDPGPRRNRQALKDIMAFWLDRGVAGFRIDMAFSLVKDDSDMVRGQEASTAVWREIREWLEDAYPSAVIVPEGHEPRTGARLAFHADFFLVIHAEHASLFDNHFAGMLPFHDQRDPFFDAEGAGKPAPLHRSVEPGQRPRPSPIGDHVDRRPRLQPALLRTANRRTARRRPDLSVHLGIRTVPLLRRRDRHAIPDWNARCRGRHLQRQLQPSGLPDPDAMG